MYTRIYSTVPEAVFHTESQFRGSQTWESNATGEGENNKKYIESP